MNPDNKEMDPIAEMLLYAASRAQHVKELIEKNLKEGKHVICDRFVCQLRVPRICSGNRFGGGKRSTKLPCKELYPTSSFLSISRTKSPLKKNGQKLLRPH